MLCVTHLSEHEHGTGLFCVCIDIAQVYKTCIHRYSKFQSWIHVGCSVHKRSKPMSSISYRMPRNRILDADIRLMLVYWLESS